MSELATLNFKGTPIRGDGLFLCLTDMWKAGGGMDARRPGDWLVSTQGTQLREYVQDNIAGNSGNIVRTETGRKGATWAHWQLALAYAQYLSSEFHAWCNEVVRAHMLKEVQVAAGQASEVTALVAVVQQLVARLDTQLPPSPLAALTSDRQQRLVRRARTLHTKAKPVWNHVAKARGYRPADEMFSTVTEGEFDIVWNLIESYRARPDKTRRQVPTHTFDGKTLKKPFNGKKLSFTLEQLTVALNHRNNTRLSEDDVDKLIDTAGIRATPWMARDGLERDVWDEDGLNWVDDTYKAGMGLDRKVGFASN